MNEITSDGRGPGTFSRWIVGGTLVAALIAAGTVVVSKRIEPQASASSVQPMASDPMAGMSMTGDGSIQISAAQIRQFGITLGSVERRTLESDVRAVGLLTFDETRVAEVVPKFAGFTERLYADFTGQAVRRGTPLLEVYSPEIVAAQEELLVASRLERETGQSAAPGVTTGGPGLTELARRRLRQWDVSEAQIDEVLRTGQPRRTVTLYAPVSGIVVEKPVLLGQSVQPGQLLYRIADLSRLWVEAELRESDAGSVQVGTAATVEPTALPGQPLAGRVEYVYPTLQQEARTLKARISVANPDGKLKPGMYADVRFSSPLRTALTVPTPAVIHTGTRRVVFVDLGGGKLLPQDVEIGRVAGELTEVLSGLEPGQRVVTSAQYLLDSESNIAEVMKSMIGQGMTGSADMGGAGADMQGMPGMDMPPKGR